MMRLSVAFFGSGSFAVPIVALLRARGVLRLLVTQDDPAFWRERVGSDVAIGRGLSGNGLSKNIFDGGIDAIITASYGARLEDEILRCARLGSYNVHASLLPRWRGASPIQRAILHNDAESGVSVIRMSDRIDCGGVVLRKRVLLRADETYDSLESRLSALGASATSELLEGLARGEVSAEEQEEASSCWAGKLKRAEGLLDWRAPADRLERQVRAFLRWPGSFFLVRGERVVVQASVVHSSRLEVCGHGAALSGEAASGEVGRVLREHPYPVVACGEGTLGLLRLQRSGRKVLEAAEFLRGFRLETGANLSEISCAKIACTKRSV